MKDSYMIGKADCGIKNMSAYIITQTRVSSLVSSALGIDKLKPIKVDLIKSGSCNLLVRRLSERVK